MGLQSNNQDACRMSEQGSLEEQAACVRISCTHEPCAGSPALSAQTHDSCHWSTAIYNPGRAALWCFHTRSAQKEGYKADWNKLKSLECCWCCFCSTSMDLAQLALHGRHKVSECSVGPDINLTYPQHRCRALARGGEFPQRQLLRN